MSLGLVHGLTLEKNLVEAGFSNILIVMARLSHYSQIDQEGLVEPKKSEIDFCVHRPYDEVHQNTCVSRRAHSIEFSNQEPWMEYSNEEPPSRKRLKPDLSMKASCHATGKPILSYWLELEFDHKKGAIDFSKLAEGSKLAKYLTRKGQRVDTSIR